MRCVAVDVEHEGCPLARLEGRSHHGVGHAALVRAQLQLELDLVRVRFRVRVRVRLTLALTLTSSLTWRARR